MYTSLVLLAAALGMLSGGVEGKRTRTRRQCNQSSSSSAPPSTPTNGGNGGGSGGGTGGGQSEYNIQDTFIGDSFFSGFDHWANRDPTHGRVNYVNEADARAQNLSFASSDTFVMRADSTTVLNPNGPGRNAVRIQSHNSYTTHVSIIDVRHMPQGCGTWPAFWEVGPNWPDNGEVDIIEGVNDQSPNLSSLHTGADCTQPSSGRAMKGTAGSDNCDVHETGNTGCGVQGDDGATSFGPGFNAAGGGWYAMERTPSAIKVFFWGRNDAGVPADVRSGAGGISPSTWGQPTALFTNDSCDLSSKFGPNNIIINLTLCGDWAGNVFGNSGCPGNCVDYVNSNPAAFADAYWDIASLRVYT